ncbi:hypothetical protein [Streptomyces sp. NBC_00286]|uniref:hypothetical protein n=1 Tax=Streptomyces sp. NBC_00286 TaxID=2975701 RepID=UPI002E2D754D|nr:hypothetical protein [Streptomyces sp. NBC_00286]
MSDPFAWASPTQTSSLKDQFPALEFVPCPGEPHTAKHVAAIVKRTAKALDEISDVLHGTGEGDWKGRHAEEFRKKFDDDFRPKVDAAKRSFSRAAKALGEWADAMPDWQRRALVLEGRAQDARDAQRAAKERLSGLPPKPLIDLPPKDDAEARKREKTEKDRSSAELAASTADAELEKIRAQARKLASDYALEGQAIARRLDKAMDIAPDEPGALDKLGDAIVDIGKALGKLDDVISAAVSVAVSEAVKWLSEHAYSIAALGDVLATVSAVLASISLVLLLFSPMTGPAAPWSPAPQQQSGSAQAPSHLAHWGCTPPPGRSVATPWSPTGRWSRTLSVCCHSEVPSKASRRRSLPAARGTLRPTSAWWTPSLLSWPIRQHLATSPRKTLARS